MSGRFSTYERPQGQRFSTVINLGQGAANKEDELFLNKLLSTFVNKQSSLFSKWIKVRITENNNNNEFKKYINSNSSSFGSKQPKSQLLVLTPLRIISLPNVDSPKRMKQFRIIDIVSLFVEENNNYTNYSAPVGVNHHNFNGLNYLNVNGSHAGGREKSHSKSSKKKLNKPRNKRTITNPQNAPSIQVLKKDVNNPSTLIYPKGSRTMSPKMINNNQQSRPTPIKQRSGGNKNNSKILQSYTIVHPSRNGYGQQQNGNSLSSNGGGIKIMKQGQNDLNGHNGHNLNGHHAKSSSSSHSLSPPPSTSLEQNSLMEDDYLASVADEPLIENHEHSKSMQSGSRSINSWASKTKSYSNTMGGYNGWLYHCCIKFHKLDVLEMSYDQLSAIHNNLKNDLDMDILDIYFESADVAQEFLDILQFYLFTLYRGVPVEYKPKIEIIPAILNGDDKYIDTIYPSDDDMKMGGDSRTMHKQLSHGSGSNKGQGPNKRNPKRKTKYPFVPSQVFIDRYVAYCDAQKIRALDSVIDYVIHTNDNDVFDVAAAFSHHHINHNYYRNGHGTHHHIAFSDEHDTPSRHQPKLSNNYSSASNAAAYYDNATRDNIHKNSKNISQQQYVALGHALAFLKMYKKLSVVRLNTDDSNIATLMKIYETNPYIHACEFNKCAIKKITMQSLSISLSSGVANLRDLAIVDINLNRGTLKELYPGLENCNLNRLVMSKCNLSEKSCVYLFTSLINTQQYKTIQHLNISHNTFGSEGTKCLSNFIYKSLNLHTLVCNDSKIDGNTFFNGLHIQFYNPATSGIKSHLEQLSYLDFSGNQIGEKGAISLSNFLQSAKSLHTLKLSRCNISTQQLHKIFEGALSNSSGLEDIDALNDDEEDDHELSVNGQSTLDLPPTQSPIMTKHQSLMSNEPYLSLNDDEKKYNGGYMSDGTDNGIQSDNEVMAYDLLRSKSSGLTSMVSSPSMSPMSNDNKANNRKNTRINADLLNKTLKMNQSLDSSIYNNVLLSYRPTRCDIIQCTDLLRLTLDISYNNLGTKGANIICQLLKNRLLNGNIGNYTIVSLSLAGNGFDVVNLSNILSHLHCCVALESLNISDNIKQNIFTNNYFSKSTRKKGNGSKKKNEINQGLLGRSLVDLCRRSTKLERLILNTNDLSVGLEPFLKNMAYLSNLKFVDLSNNKFNDKHIFLLITALSYNRTFIRALKIGGNNKITTQCLTEYLTLLSNHTSLIDVNTCLPMQHIMKYIKIKKYSALFTRLQNEASLNLRNNKSQYDIDKKMVNSLPIRERLEKILRLQCGQQFGIPLESIRGTVKFVDYESRIPKILINLRNYLKSKGGFKTKEIFRFHADASQFNKFKQDLNANNKDAKTDDMHSVANAIKAFYHDLPIKVLNNVNINILQSVNSVDNVEIVMKLIKEPYKSLFEWLLDLCVDIVTRERHNKMTHRSMAVVLCPSLYNACTATPKILRSVMEFTDYCIQWRIGYRKKRPLKYEEEIIEDPATKHLRKSQLLNGLLGGNNLTADGRAFAYQSFVNKWNSVMKEMTSDDMEQQAWNNCALEQDHEMKYDDHPGGDRQNVKFCYCIDRLTFILQYYKRWLKNRQINPRRQSKGDIQQLISKFNHKMHDFIASLTSYSNVQLINDFNHILRYHSSDVELEDIMVNLKQAMGGCLNISQCTCMIRNNRNRDRDENRPYKMKIYFGYKDPDELCTQQILDKIHCYFFHTFDTLRLNMDESRKVNQINTLQVGKGSGGTTYAGRKSTTTYKQQQAADAKLRILKDTLQPKSEKLGQIRGLHRVKGTKFSSNIPTFINRINNNQTVDIDDMLGNDDDIDDDDIYKLGQTFDYWDGMEQSSNGSLMQSPSSITKVHSIPSPSSTSQHPSIKLPGPFGNGNGKDQQTQPKVSPNGSPSPNDWYVSKKYNNFKEEILHNSIRQLACDSWNDCYAKALILQKSTIAKRVKSIRSKPPTPNSPTPMPPFGSSATDLESKEADMVRQISEEEYHITVMPISFLMAVLLYCDFDNLRFALNATFYPSSMNETITNWKLRHAEYCHWSQFLRDAVMNSGGIDMGEQNMNRNNIVLYHSTTSQTSLSPKFLKICYPMSCNPHLSVVHTFSPKNGVVLALKRSREFPELHHLNCSWISDYANYDENIIFGSSNKRNIVKITNIINIRTSQNYQTFWNAISMLYQIINGRKINDAENSALSDTFTEEDMQCLSILIQSQMCRSDSTNGGYNRSMSSLSGSSHRRRLNIQRMIPPYIDQIFTAFCRNYIFGQIILCPSDFISLPLIYKHLFDNFGWIKIDLFCNVFINIESIRIIKVILNENIFDSLCKFLSQFYQKRRGAIARSNSTKRDRRSSVLELISGGGQSSSNGDSSNNLSINGHINGRNRQHSQSRPKHQHQNGHGHKNQKNDDNLQLTTIEFINVDEKYTSCKQCVDKYQQNLNDIGWNIKYVQSSLYINKQ